MRARTTNMKARDLTRGMVLDATNSWSGEPVSLTIESVERAADAVERYRDEIVKARSRPKLRDAANGLIVALDAIESNGREARLVRFFGKSRPVDYSSGEEVRFVRYATTRKRERNT